MTMQSVGLLLGEPKTTEGWHLSEWLARRHSATEWDHSSLRSTSDDGIEFVFAAATADSPRSLYEAEAQSYEPIDLVLLGEPKTTQSWLVSDWLAGQSSIMEWDPSNVRSTADGGIELLLDAAPTGSSRPFYGGEVQSCERASTGTWTWTAQAPDMQDGAIFGLFTYQAEWETDRWLEFDFEFVGADTTKIQLNIHMEDAAGRHITLAQAMGGPVIVDLGFDAAQGLHTYEIVSTGTEVAFLVDGKEIGRYGAADMPGGVWYNGDMKGYADLWAADAGEEAWAGDWTYGGTPLVAKIAALDVRPGDLSPLAGTATGPGAGDDVLTGTTGNDVLEGLGGNDTLSGGAGNDQLLGGEGQDLLLLDLGDDLLDGGSGVDTLVVQGSTGATINLSSSVAQVTGYGTDRIIQIENVTGGAGADKLTGSAGANVLSGAGGNDTIKGQGGSDTLIGGLGRDSLYGGADQDADRFVFNAVAESALGTKRDSISQFVSGVDEIDLSGIDVRTDLAGDQAFMFGGTTAGAYSVWWTVSRGNAMLRADVTGDGRADFEIRLAGVTHLTADDLLL